MVVFGLDFGTTFSTLSALKGKEVYVLKQNNSAYIPTYLFFHDFVRNVAYGYDAEKLAHDRSVRGAFFRDLKRWIGCTENNYLEYKAKLDPKYHTSINSRVDGCDFRVLLMGDYYGTSALRMTLPDLVASFVRCIIRDGERSFDTTCSGVVCSVPAAFNSIQRNFMMECVTLSGYNCLHIINEPSAAAFSAFRKIPKDMNFVMVYDFGGGTFDVSAVSVRSNTFVVRASGGDMNLGGRDVDRALLEFIHRKAKVGTVDYTIDISSIKEKVSSALTSFEYDLPVGDKFVSVLVTVEDVSGVVIPFIERTIRIMHDVYKKFVTATSQSAASIDHHRKCGVIAVGGSSYLPGLMAVLSAVPFVANVIMLPDARAAVSAGCALYSLCLDKESSMLLVDCAAHSLSIPSYLCQSIVVVPKGAPIPFSGTRDITLMGVNARAKFYAALFEGDHKKCGKNELIFANSIILRDIGVNESSPNRITVVLEVNVSSVGTIKFGVKLPQGKLYVVGKDRPYDFSRMPSPSRDIVRLADELNRRVANILYSTRYIHTRERISEDEMVRFQSQSSTLTRVDIIKRFAVKPEEADECDEYLNGKIEKEVRGSSVLKLELD
ncbi:67 kDa protein [Rehmannia virus 1]|uniref:67 kDa protein n=1 Tax=Rehmannia virus 1 TaxID=2316740 RepID=A0A385HW62_9CLOS|nr:67 kDa protein [Rehmannia virus 1]AXY55035.1 67 kDa protein [Rehmannia virus 1]